jgi:iron complex outermembrane recepter protein
MIKALVTAVCWGSVVAGGVQVAWAQPTGELAGTVRDATGAVIHGATVTLVGGTLAAPVAIETDHRGRFAIRLPPGVYEMAVVAAGFEPWSTDVELKASGVTLDVPLRLDALSDRVTVTATRTGISDIQTTGVAITALDTDTLDQASVERIEHLPGLVPTLSVSHTPSGTPLMTLRGIGSNSAVPGAEPNVTMQVDGVYLARGSSMAFDFLDVERVEVLRGPQGTLFGRNSIGGTINIVTRQPTNALETRARFTAGNYGKLRVEGAISGPLVRNRVMGSFALLRGSRDGFVVHADDPDRSLGSEDTWAGRGQLRMVFPSRHELLVSIDHSDARGVPLTLARPLAPNPFGPPGPPIFEVPDDFWSVRPNDAAEGRNRQSGTSARLSVRLGDTATLTTLTAYRGADFRLFVDSDTTERPLATTRVSDLQRQISQEVTLGGRTAKSSWITGASWFDERIRAPFELTLLQPGIQARLNAAIDTNAWALFGQARYLVTDRVAVTGGLRYSHERERAHSRGEQFLLRLSMAVDPYEVIAAVADAAWTPKGSLELEASRDTYLFLSATRGFKSGGINLTARTADMAPFRPELAWSYEAGVKRTLPDGRGHVNAAFFYVDYRDLQVVSFVGPGILDVSNAGRATSRGVEVEGTLSAGRGLQFRGTLAWLDAVYGQYTAVERGPGLIDATGNRLREAPEYSGGGSAIYGFQPAAIGTVSMRGDVSWQSRVFFSPSNVAVQSQSPYALAHARATFVPRSRRWEASVYVRNLGRQEYVTATWEATANVAISGRPGEPRHWGTQFTIRR